MQVIINTYYCWVLIEHILRIVYSTIQQANTRTTVLMLYCAVEPL